MHARRVHAAVLLPSRPPAYAPRRSGAIARVRLGRRAVLVRALRARPVARNFGAAEDGAAEDAAPPEGDFVGQPVTDAAIASLRWYKRTISPLLPPGCRFVPTCSEYAVQSFQRFSPPQAAGADGVAAVRCNPTGGQGVDEPDVAAARVQRRQRRRAHRARRRRVAREAPPAAPPRRRARSTRRSRSR